MTEPRNLLDLTVDLPVPRDDGACDHLPGMRLPSLALRATDGTLVDLSKLTGQSVVYIYPPHGAGRSATAVWVGPYYGRPRQHDAVLCVSRPRRQACSSRRPGSSG
jgi:hypothetical protein